MGISGMGWIQFSDAEAIPTTKSKDGIARLAKQEGFASKVCTELVAISIAHTQLSPPMLQGPSGRREQFGGHHQQQRRQDQPESPVRRVCKTIQPDHKEKIPIRRDLATVKDLCRSP